MEPAGGPSAPRPPGRAQLRGAGDLPGQNAPAPAGPVPGPPGLARWS